MRIARALAFGSVLITALGAVAAPVGAQIRASERAGVSQTIDGTTIAVEYSAPRVRGRAPLFAERGVVRWGEVWTPGANYATTIEVNRPVTLDGRAIDKGRYSVWLIVREGPEWTMVLDPDHRRFHMEWPDSNAKQIRFAVRHEASAFEEVLQWRFTDLAVSGATLSMRWGAVRVDMKVAVTPSLRMPTPADEAASFLGRFDWTFLHMFDSTKTYTLALAHEKGYLMGHLRPTDSWPVDFALVRVAKDWYTFGLFDGDEIVDVEATWVLEFKRDATGKVVSFEVRDDTDMIQVKGVRRP